MNWRGEPGMVISRHGQDIPTTMALRDIVGSVVVDHLYTSDHAPEPPESRSPRNRTATRSF
jgi:hypothetical protein